MMQEAERTFKIGEVCRMADLQPYVLRYWETEFPALAPSKSGGGQRLYSQREIDVILRIKQLLYAEGFTIAGAKKKLEAELNEKMELVGASTPPDGGSSPARPSSEREAIGRIKRELALILEMLEDE